MKWISAVLVVLFLLLGCSSSTEEVPCKDIALSDHDNKDWLFAQCIEEAAVETYDVLTCNYIPGTVQPPEEGQRIYSRETCRNQVQNAIAVATTNPQKCELINEQVHMYRGKPPQNAVTSAQIKSECRDVLTN